LLYLINLVLVKISHYRSEEALRVPGGSGFQNF